MTDGTWAGTRARVSSDRQPLRSLREALVGSWTLVSWVQTDIETGEEFLPVGESPVGYLLYTPDGYMSAQIATPGRDDFADGDMSRGTPDEYMAAGRSYLAYSGPYYVDEARAAVEHGMTISLFPNWTGDRQLRLVDLDGDVLRLNAGNPIMYNGRSVDTTVTWHRAVPNS
jgi:Lipocalin-like domain